MAIAKIATIEICKFLCDIASMRRSKINVVKLKTALILRRAV